MIKPNKILQRVLDSLYLVNDRMQVLNQLQRDLKTVEFEGKRQRGRKRQKQQRKKTQRKRKCRNSSRQKRRERRRARMKRRIRTNSGAISMSEVEASSMAEPVSTKKKKKNWTFENCDNHPQFSNPWGWTAVFMVHWVFHICRFLRLKEPFWWTVSS